MVPVPRLIALLLFGFGLRAGMAGDLEPRTLSDRLAPPQRALVPEEQFKQLQSDLQEKGIVVEKVCAYLPFETRGKIPDIAAAAQIAQQAVASGSGRSIEEIQQSIEAAAKAARQLISAARTRAEADASKHGETLINEADAYRILGDAEQAAGRSLKAIEAYRESSKLLDRDSHPEKWAKIVVHLGKLLQYVSHYDEACEIYEAALSWASQSPLLGSDHAVSLELLDGLAASYCKRGYYPKATSLIRRALNARERLLGRDHSDTIRSVNQLAAVLGESGDIARAEPLFRRALSTREQMDGAEHPDTIVSVNDLAQLLVKKGDLAGAEPLFQRALSFRERTLGPLHPDTLNSMNNLANLLSIRGDPAAAEPLLRRAAAGRDQVLGYGHPDTLASLGNLACLLADKGDLVGAEPLLRRALAAQEHKLGLEDVDTLTTADNLAIVLEAKGDVAEAEALYRRVLESRKRTLGEEHRDVARSCFNLSLFLTKRKASTEALLLARQAVTIARATVPEGHPDRAAYEKHLVTLDNSATTRARKSVPAATPRIFRKSGDSMLRN